MSMSCVLLDFYIQSFIQLERQSLSHTLASQRLTDLRDYININIFDTSLL